MNMIIWIIHLSGIGSFSYILQQEFLRIIYSDSYSASKKWFEFCMQLLWICSAPFSKQELLDPFHEAL